MFTQSVVYVCDTNKGLSIIHIWCAHCLNKVTVVCILTCCPEPQSRKGNRSWHSRSPSEQTCLLVRLYPDTEKEHHAPVPVIIQGDVEFGTGPLEEGGRGDEEDKVHPHLLVVAPEWPAVDKLLAKKSTCARYQGC
jgi:hypothetical protein